MTEAYIGIGSNLGKREEYFGRAIEMLKDSPGIKIVTISPVYETEPVGGPAQGKFLNGVIKLQTELSPRELLERLHGIEDSLGRVRTVKNGPRAIDLDILTYGDLKVSEEGLEIPHPRMNQRAFVKRPLSDLRPCHCEEP